MSEANKKHSQIFRTAEKRRNRELFQTVDIPKTDNAIVLRSDFSNDVAWERICTSIQTPVGDFCANVNFVSDQSVVGMSLKQLVEILSKANSHHTFAFIVDSISLSSPDMPILVVDLHEKPGRTFRVIPSGMWIVENNLSICNMDFSDFLNNAGSDGVFRGI